MTDPFKIITARILLVGVMSICLSVSAPSQQRRGTGRPSVNQKQPNNLSVSALFDQLKTRATATRESGQLSEAINLYQKAVVVRPNWAEGWWYLGALNYELDKYAEAREAYRRFVALEPKGGAAWAFMGLCEFQLHNYEAALAFIERGRSLGLGDGEQLVFVTRYHAAILLTRFGQYEEALEILTYFARTLPTENQAIVEALGLAMLRMPFLPAEITGDKRALVQQMGKATYDNFAHRTGEARQSFDQLIARYPNTPNVHYANGVLLLQENPEAAITEFHRELEISPAHVPALLQLAFAYVNQHQYASGLPLAEQAVRLDPKSFAARNALGRILTETGDLARAIKELEIGLKLAPDSPEMYFALARAYGRAGRKEDAEQARTKFVSLDRIRRTQREGSQAVGGTQVQTLETKPE